MVDRLGQRGQYLAGVGTETEQHGVGHVDDASIVARNDAKSAAVIAAAPFALAQAFWPSASAVEFEVSIGSM